MDTQTNLVSFTDLVFKCSTVFNNSKVPTLSQPQKQLVWMNVLCCEWIIADSLLSYTKNLSYNLDDEGKQRHIQDTDNILGLIIDLRKKQYIYKPYMISEGGDNIFYVRIIFEWQTCINISGGGWVNNCMDIYMTEPFKY